MIKYYSYYSYGGTGYNFLYLGDYGEPSEKKYCILVPSDDDVRPKIQFIVEEEYFGLPKLTISWCVNNKIKCLYTKIKDTEDYVLLVSDLNKGQIKSKKVLPFKIAFVFEKNDIDKMNATFAFFLKNFDAAEDKIMKDILYFSLDENALCFERKRMDDWIDDINRNKDYTSVNLKLGLQNGPEAFALVTDDTDKKEMTKIIQCCNVMYLSQNIKYEIDKIKPQEFGIQSHKKEDVKVTDEYDNNKKEQKRIKTLSDEIQEISNSVSASQLSKEHATSNSEEPEKNDDRNLQDNLKTLPVQGNHNGHSVYQKLIRMIIVALIVMLIVVAWAVYTVNISVENKKLKKDLTEIREENKKLSKQIKDLQDTFKTLKNRQTD